MWGTLAQKLGISEQYRITPTCVGNTNPFLRTFVKTEDHPHLCGEHVSSVRRCVCSIGSPPPVWGTPSSLYNWPYKYGITPTCVGNTYACITSGNRYKDHPHLCGEHVALDHATTAELGSPPPVWGTHWDDENAFWCSRITPTCVGNTVIDPYNDAILKSLKCDFRLVSSPAPS